MKVFISWSGDTSHKVALALRDWLPSVLQSVEPYVSSEDIEKGARWNTEIGRQLDETAFGILCVTTENLASSWLNFEAGALSKSMEASRVSPFLLDLRPAELVGPLSQFQAALPRVDDIARLVKSINKLSENPVEEGRLVDAVAMWWPRLEERLNEALVSRTTTPTEPQRDTREMIEELLEITRGLQSRVFRDMVGVQKQQAVQLDYGEDLEVRPILRRAFEQVLDEVGLDSETAVSIRGSQVRILLDSQLPTEIRKRLEEVADAYHVDLQLLYRAT
jgi:hypothetical protein